MGVTLVIAMAGLVILMIAKMRGPVDDRATMVVLTRDDLVGTEVRGGAWGLVIVLLFVVFLSILMR
jgi:hypothetical protein